jgi:cardiolipin synthase (CMP-forming)
MRLLAAPFLAWLLLQSHFRAALGLTLAAGVTDWFDGFAARRLGTTGQIGVVLDPIADKVMLVTLFVALTVVGLLPGWLLVLVLGRDLVIVIGAFVLRVWRGVRRFLPSMLGKISTFFQIALVLSILLHAAFQNRFLLWLEYIGVALSAVFTASSGVDYVRRGIRLGWNHRTAKVKS